MLRNCIHVPFRKFWVGTLRRIWSTNRENLTARCACRTAHRNGTIKQHFGTKGKRHSGQTWYRKELSERLCDINCFPLWQWHNDRNKIEVLLERELILTGRCTYMIPYQYEGTNFTVYSSNFKSFNTTTQFLSRTSQYQLSRDTRGKEFVVSHKKYKKYFQNLKKSSCSFNDNKTLSIFKPHKCMGSGGTAPPVINLGASRMSTVRFTHQPMCLRGRNFLYTLKSTAGPDVAENGKFCCLCLIKCTDG